MKALIVCYSYLGNTYRVAQAIQQMTQAELCQIFPSQPWRSVWALPRRTSSPTRGSSPTPPGTTPIPSRKTRSSTTPMRRKSPRTAPRSWTSSTTPALRAAHLPGRRARHVRVQQFICHHPQQLVLNFPHRLFGGGEQICPHPGKIDAGLVDVAFRHRDGDYPLGKGTFGICPGCRAIYIETRRKLLRSLRRKNGVKTKKTGPPAWENQAGSPALSRRVPWTSTVRKV